MNLINQSWSFEEDYNGIEILKKIEKAGKTCYKKEHNITPDSYKNFIQMIMSKGHLSVIEHQNITVRIISNRGAIYELVRHRIISASQESTRYVNYSNKDMEFIKPIWYDNSTDESKKIFIKSLENIEQEYNDLITLGWSPQYAREILPNALKTEIVVTTNLREWRHIFNLRADKAAHPQIRFLMLDMLKKFKELIPIVFDDIYEEKLGE